MQRTTNRASRSVIATTMLHIGALFLVTLAVLVGWRRRSERDEVVDILPLSERRFRQQSLASLSPSPTARPQLQTQSADRPSFVPFALVWQAIKHSALHERILFFYMLGLLTAVTRVGGEQHERATFLLGMDIALLVLAVITVRAPLTENRFVIALVSRLIVFAGLLGTFVQLYIILPAARNGTLDETLHAFDLRVFGFEPATLFDRWVTVSSTEWFSFFYFSYFVLLAIHVLPFMLIERRLSVIGQFALGMVALYCIGQLTYVIVPGFGPYRTLTFVHPLAGETWWPLVQSGAASVHETSRTDIFPSLHTAGPVFLGLFSFKHRALKPFKYTWPLIAFFATQIMLATMFLRWHYLIDVIAGVALAAFATKLSGYAKVEEHRRATAREAQLWTNIPWRDLLTLVGIRGQRDARD